MLPRPARRHVALLALLVALAGCAVDRSSDTSSGEIRWLERLSRWEARMNAAAEQASSAYAAALAGDQPPDSLRASLGPISRCSRRLGDDVGKAPKRYATGYKLMLRACARYERYAEELERSLVGDPEDALLASEMASDEAYRLVLLARRAIENVLTANRELPRVGGASDASRVEPLFSRAASGVVGRDVDVVCWSRDEWPNVLREWGAYIGTTDFGAFAHVAEDRADLGPEYCQRLVDLAYRKRRPARDDGADEIADSVATLAHESEHLAAPAADEAETECYGMQDIRRVARLLGASRQYAGLLADLYWDDVYETLPSDYISPDCRDGGFWDRNRSDSAWP